jgi:L-amino acid N-acyltransferase YncA
VTTFSTTRNAVIAPMTAAHADEVLAIYQAGIDEGNATFETATPAWEAFEAGKLPEHRFVALHTRAGFRVIGTRERIGRHDGVWRDVVLIERRSPAIT